jgi:hypothetical protein
MKRRGRPPSRLSTPARGGGSEEGEDGRADRICGVGGEGVANGRDGQICGDLLEGSGGRGEGGNQKRRQPLGRGLKGRSKSRLFVC